MNRNLALALALSVSLGCATLPEDSFKKHAFPEKGAFVEDINWPYATVGVVRSKVNFSSLDANREVEELCRNYYNKAVHDLIDKAKDEGADAVIDVKSVVFLADGRRETYPTPECADDGAEGQILVQGVAVKWTKESGAPPASVGGKKKPTPQPSVEPEAPAKKKKSKRK